MPIISKPDYNIFASEAKNGEVTAFPNLLRGWGVTIDQTAGKPPMEWFNALQKRTDEWLTYLSQRGLPEWQDTLDYPKNAVVQFGGKFYVALKETTDQQPDSSQPVWQEMINFLGVSEAIENLKKEVAGKLAKDQNGADIPDPALFAKNLGLGEAAKRDVGTGANQIPDMSSFTGSSATTGWRRYPGGLIFQWGQTGTSASTLVSSTFPIPFPNNVFQIVGSCMDVDNANTVAINSTDRAGFNLVAWVAQLNSGTVTRTQTLVKWIAIGN